MRSLLHKASIAESNLRLNLALIILRRKPRLVITLSHMGYINKCRGVFHIVDCPLAHPYYVREHLFAEYKKIGLGPRSMRMLPCDSIRRKEHESIASADIAVVPSSFVKETLVMHGISESKIITIPYGCNLSDSEDDSGLPLERVKPREFEILFVGGVGVRKGIHTLLEAFDLLKADNKRLTIVGPIGWDGALLRDKFNDTRVSFVGKVAHADLPLLYRRASVFVLPSIAEGLAMVLGEAVSFGLPIIASSASGVSNLLSDPNAFIEIPPASPSELANALCSLANNPTKLQEMRKAVLECKAKMQGWNNYSRAWAALIEKCL